MLQNNKNAPLELIDPNSKINTAGHLVIGVDPGLSGGLAIYDLNSKKLIAVHDMPLEADPRAQTHFIDKMGRQRPHKYRSYAPVQRAIDIYALGLLLDQHSAATAFAVVEDVHSMPAQGVVSVFTFGKGFGMVLGALGALMIPVHLTKAATWKCLLGLTKDKTLSRNRAAELFPEFASQWSRKRDDGRAEAALLAYFGAVKFGGLHHGRAPSAG